MNMLPGRVNGAPTSSTEPAEDPEIGWTGNSTHEYGPGELADEDPNHPSNQDPRAAQDATRYAAVLAGPEALSARMHTTMCATCKAAERLRPDQYCEIGFRLSEAVPVPATYRCRCPRCVARRVALGLPAI